MKTARLAVAAALAAIAGCGDSDDEESAFRVMSQNAYYGFPVGILLEAPAEEIPIRAAEAFEYLLATDFAGRAEAMADKIAEERPHLIGLQEMALIRLQSPGDAVEGGVEPAEVVLFDYVQILLDALAARGLDYRVAGSVENVDVELPMITGLDPLTFDDVRLTDRDVVLARGDVEIGHVVTGNYEARASVPSLGIEIKRGYVALDAGLGGTARCRFVCTHLEDTPFDDIQLHQAQELVELLEAERKAVILVGDFNSPAPTGPTYKRLLESGYADAQVGDGGLTWGHDPDLANPSDAFTMRLDLVLTRGSRHPIFPVHLEARSLEVWGDDLEERTESGLWPSDHAAVIAEFGVVSGVSWR